MSASDRTLVLLDDRYPNVSRMTRFRISREPDFPTPIIVRNKKYFYAHELSEWEETHRRIKGERKAASAAEVESTPQ
jgi:hypothetical protein